MKTMGTKGGTRGKVIRAARTVTGAAVGNLNIAAGAKQKVRMLRHGVGKGNLKAVKAAGATEYATKALARR